ncbi:MAG TPA: TIR domain-containing protein [Caulobacteraceae bacterium]
MAHDVFISYSSKDKTTADAICAVLERDGIRCWIAPRDVTPGHDWAESIIQAIHGSKAFILLFSGFSNTSGQIKREVERAADREIPIIPFRLDDIEPNESLEFFISTPHWMDAFTPPLEGHIQQLSETLRQLIAKDGAPAGSASVPSPMAAHPVIPPSPAPTAKPGIGAMAPWLIVAGLAAVIVVGGAVLLLHQGASPSNQHVAVVESASLPVAPALSAAPVPSPVPAVAAADQRGIAAAAPPTAASSPTLAISARSCIVADPTPTPLNIRTTPNGRIALTMDNGAAVHVIGRATVNGQSWSQIGSGQDGPLLGWVFSGYLNCG